MTTAQCTIIKLAKAIEYYDQFIPAIGKYDEKANEASRNQQILEEGIYALRDYNLEKIDKALDIIRLQNL